MKIIFDDLAAEEFHDAIEYYEIQLQDLGKSFREEIKRALRTIRRFPKIGAIEEGDIRRYILHRFPCKIMYSIESDYIYIIAIAHTHREPSYWIDRVGK